ncbi:hypothetical protein, partial [Streptomyces yerevanensis]|uniref:hypothetical protein n=1 Tax=Streptomyces yerevanensis TaxID=66378 RepID=UPI001B804B88
FGTLLSSQGTDASFVLTLAGFPPGFPSVLRLRLYQKILVGIPVPFGLVPHAQLRRVPVQAEP